MANAATALTVLPVSFRNSANAAITPVVITFDTTASDLTVYTPAAGKNWALVGLTYQEASAHDLTIKDNATTLVTLEKTANDGIIYPISKPLFVGSEHCVFNVSVVVSTMLAYFIDFSLLEIE